MKIVYVDNSHGFFHTASRYLISISSTVGYEALYAITRLKTSMESILDYVEYPLPAICYQAVKVTSWFYLFSAALSAQNWCVGDETDWCQTGNITQNSSQDLLTLVLTTLNSTLNSTELSQTGEPENDSYWWFFKVYE